MYRLASIGEANTGEVRMRYMSFAITIQGELRDASGYSGKIMMKHPAQLRLEESLHWNMVKASEE